MSVQQCEECRLALVRAEFDAAAGVSDLWGCQLEDALAEQTREMSCPFYVGWTTDLPPPTRSCKTSQGRIDGCSTTSSCGDCGSSGGCGSGGCGLGDPAEALDFKWDPEAEEGEEPPASAAAPSAKSCSAQEFLERLKLGRDEDFPLPVPLED